MTSTRIFVDIPMEHYNNLVQRCAADRPEFETLKNGVINRVKEPQAVEILCRVEEARMLLDFASRTDPQAAAHVAHSIDAGRQAPLPTNSSRYPIRRRAN